MYHVSFRTDKKNRCLRQRFFIILAEFKFEVVGHNGGGNEEGQQIGGQLEAGFSLLALYEDTNGEGRLHEMNIPTFLASRSVK